MTNWNFSFLMIVVLLLFAEISSLENLKKNKLLSKMMNIQESTKRICFTVSEISTSESRDQFGISYGKSGEGQYLCDVYGAQRGERICCDAKWRDSYRGSEVYPSPLNFYTKEFLTITNYGSDGLRIKSIEVPGVIGDKFYPLKSRSGMYQGKLSGGCFTRFWIDRSGNGSCMIVVIVLDNNYHSSSDGDCLKIICR